MPDICACVLFLQNFFRSYKKLAGMTGTAATEASEFDNIYKLPVTVVPTNQKVCRTDESDVVFSKEEGTSQLMFAEPIPASKFVLVQGGVMFVALLSSNQCVRSLCWTLVGVGRHQAKAFRV